MRLSALIALPYAAIASALPPKAKLPAVVFTPGAWHGPAVFDEVRHHLKTQGYDSEAATLATVGSTDPSTGVPQDTANVRAIVKKLVDKQKEVVVVAHSYGGVPTSGAVEGLGIKDLAADGKKGGVIMVLYMTSFAIPAGTSLEDGLGGVYPAWWNITVRTASRILVSVDFCECACCTDRLQGDFFSPSDPANVFYGDVDPKTTKDAVAALRPMPLQAVKDKSTFAPWNNGFEVGYIFAEQDEAIALDTQKSLASQFPAGSFTASLPSSHSPFLSMPKKVADVVDDAVNHAVSRKVE